MFWLLQVKCEVMNRVRNCCLVSKFHRWPLLRNCWLLGGVALLLRTRRVPFSTRKALIYVPSQCLVVSCSTISGHPSGETRSWFHITGILLVKFCLAPSIILVLPVRPFVRPSKRWRLVFYHIKINKCYGILLDHFNVEFGIIKFECSTPHTV